MAARLATLLTNPILGLLVRYQTLRSWIMETPINAALTIGAGAVPKFDETGRGHAQPRLELFVPKFDETGRGLVRLTKPRVTVSLNRNHAGNCIVDDWTGHSNASRFTREPWTGATKLEYITGTLVSSSTT